MVEPDYAICHMELLDETYARLLPVKWTISGECIDTIKVLLTGTMGPAMVVSAQLTTWMTHAIETQKVVE